MNTAEEGAVLKAVQKKFPVCTVVDAREYDGGMQAQKCSEGSKTVEIALGKRRFTILLCTGSFNVYVLNIEEIV